MCLDVGLSRRSQNPSFKNASEPFHSVENDKIIMLKYIELVKIRKEITIQLFKRFILVS